VQVYNTSITGAYHYTDVSKYTYSSSSLALSYCLPNKKTIGTQ